MLLFERSDSEVENLSMKTGDHTRKIYCVT